jgi:hypothetical protein
MAFLLFQARGMQGKQLGRTASLFISRVASALFPVYSIHSSGHSAELSGQFPEHGLPAQD